MTRNDGGANPEHENSGYPDPEMVTEVGETEYGGTCEIHMPVMELRDWFAGQVAPGCMMAVVGKTEGHVAEEIFVGATAAYRMADALVAAKEKTRGSR